jgi:hypothetical protein
MARQRRGDVHAALDPQVLCELATGSRLFRRADDPQHTEASLRQAWHAIGEALTAEHARLLPGTRPHAWWRFSAPERRRQMAGPVHTMLQPGSQVLQQYAYGRPSTHGVEDFGCVFECQCAYLRRHGLLSAGEARCGDCVGCRALDCWCAGCTYRGFGEPHLSRTQVQAWYEETL